MIVKIQKRLDDPRAPLLVYQRRRRGIRFVPVIDMPLRVITAVASGHPAYFEATIENDSYVIGERVGDQPW